MLTFLAEMAVVFLVLMCLRHYDVYKYRMRQVDLIEEASRIDELHGHDYKWRWVKFNEVADLEMTLKFWRSFGSFFPDTSFLISSYPALKIVSRSKR